MSTVTGSWPAAEISVGNATIVTNMRPRHPVLVQRLRLAARLPLDYPGDSKDGYDNALVATMTGSAIYGPGHFSMAKELSESTANLITNPQFTTDVAGWTALSASLLSRSTSGYFSQGCLLIRGITGDGYAGVQSGSFVVTNQEYTLSAYATNRDIPAGATVSLYPYWTGGAQAAAYGTAREYEIADLSGWKRLTYSVLPDETDRTGLALVVKADSLTANGQGFYLDAAQVEAKDYATPFYDGSRVPITCRITNTLLAKQGTITAWASADDLGHAAGKAKYLFADSASDGNFEGYVLEGGSAFFEVAGVAGTGMTGVATGWHHWAFTWSDANNKREIYYDGSPLYSGAYAEQALGANLYIGSDYAGTDGTQWNGYLDDFVAHRRFLDSDEIAGIYNTPYAHSL